MTLVVLLTHINIYLLGLNDLSTWFEYLSRLNDDLVTDLWENK